MELRIAKSAVEGLQAIQADDMAQAVPHIVQDFVTAIVQHIEIAW